jgi:hypothetical protein
MDSAKIFLVDDKQEGLIPMTETAYVTEDVLQDLLAHYPDLLPGDQIDPENPLRWLLVSREMSVPGEMDEPGRWSLDHLFLDQDGIPTFVECKRATDTRSRREVVAQMLDYAANGVEYWGIDRIRQAAAETAKQNVKMLDDEIVRLLDSDEADIDGYWKTVVTNLQDKRVRLIFVMDDIPKELRRLVEFLNEEMAHVQVLAVEVKQFQRQDGRGQKALVPRVIGSTETAREIKAQSPTSGKKHITSEDFFNKCPAETSIFFKRVIQLAQERNHVIYWGTVGFSVRAQISDGRDTFAYGWSSSVFQFYFGGNLRSWLSEEELVLLRKELMAEGVFQESGNWTLTADVTKENLEHMNKVYDFILDKMDEIVKKAAGETSEDV